MEAYDQSLNNLQTQNLGETSRDPYAFISTFKLQIQTNKHFIETGSFITNILLDLGGIIISIVIWRFLWVRLGILEIKDIYPQTPDSQSYVKLKDFRSILKGMKCLRKILTNLSNLKSFIEHQCGFQAFTYLFFLRRLIHIMAILTITDLCVWLPYQLFFQDWYHFSLITMPSKNNEAFRTFYSLWVAVVVLYGMQDMRSYLQMRIRFRQLRDHNTETVLLNSLKSKTLHVHFLTDNVGDSELRIKSKLLEELNIQARILAMLRIPNYSEQIELQYKMKIQRIVQRVGIDKMSPLWRLIKAKPDKQVEKDMEDIHSSIQEGLRIHLQRLMPRQSKSINSYFVILEDIKTAEYLCENFDTEKALINVIPYFGYGDIESQYQLENRKMIIKWAQEPKDIMWINMAPHKVKFTYFILFNLFCVVLLFMGFAAVTVASNQSIFEQMFIPKVAVPYVLILFNSLIRLLISKATEWENKLFQYQVQIKEFKVLCIYFIINVVVGSVVRDTLNLLDVLKTGWGWIEMLGLIYQQIDGYFYYLFIFNQTTIAFLIYLIKPGEIFLDVFESRLSYYKMTEVKHQSMYAINDTFRYGYSYALDFIVLSVVLLYSCSNPLIHFFGFIYFYSKFYLNGYTLVVFHKYEECCSNMRLIQKVISMITLMVVIWIFLTATLTVFENTYSNVLILYIFVGGVIYMHLTKHRPNPLEDHVTNDALANHDLSSVIAKWKQQYRHPVDPKNYLNYNELYQS